MRELPEIVRLGWLLGRLSLNQAVAQGESRGDQTADAIALAAIPPILAAAEYVELSRLDTDMLAQALVAWHATAAEPQRLGEWWQADGMSTNEWPAKLAALSRCLTGG